MLSVRSASDISRAEWDAIVESSPDGWVWGLSGWRRLILAVDRWQLEDLSFGIADGDALVAVVPLQYQPASAAVASSGWGLVGPVLSNELTAQRRAEALGVIMAHVETLAREKGAARIDLGASALTESSRSSGGVSPFAAFGYSDTSTQTKIIDLRAGEAAVWAAISENAKRKIKRAQKLGCTVERVSWSGAVDAYYEAHRETYERTGVTPHPKQYFEGIARELGPSGHSVLWEGRSSDGTAIAYRNDARLGAGVLYHTGCSLNVALDSGINYLLVWEAIRGAIRDGFSWYEVGEVFPSATEGKAKSLTEFKSRFGGELYPYYKGTKQLAATASVTAASPVRDEQVIKSAYQDGALYAPTRICRRPDEGDDWADRLLHAKLDTVRAAAGDGLLVDLCCGAGAHLLSVVGDGQPAMGIDFTSRYLSTAREEAAAVGRPDLEFVQADARRLPLATGSVSLLYSFSALYVIPDAAQVVAEIGRVLKPGGRAVLEFGNRRALNVFCLRYYPEWPPVQPMTLAEIRRALAAAGLVPIRHRRFQLLPLWAGRPAWLAPLLHPAWKALLKRRVAGRMLDEWVSSLPVLRRFAFRHVIVCRKEAATAA